MIVLFFLVSTWQKCSTKKSTTRFYSYLDCTFQEACCLCCCCMICSCWWIAFMCSRISASFLSWARWISAREGAAVVGVGLVQDCILTWKMKQKTNHLLYKRKSYWSFQSTTARKQDKYTIDPRCLNLSQLFCEFLVKNIRVNIFWSKNIWVERFLIKKLKNFWSKKDFQVRK